MKNKWLISLFSILIIIVLIFITFIWLRPTAGDNELVVYSEHKDLMLTIPRTALPPGIDPGSLKVRAEESEQPSGIKVYNLEPAGTTFLAPIKLSLIVPYYPDQGLPLVFHQSDNELTALSDAGYEIKGPRATLNTTISHFSRIVRIEAPFAVDFVGGGEYALGQSFSYQVIVEPKANLHGDTAIYYAVEREDEVLMEVDTEEGGVEYIPAPVDKEKKYMAMANLDFSSPWQIMPFSINATDGLSPSQAELAGDTGKSLDELTFTTNFSCAKEGRENLYFKEGIPVKFIIRWNQELPFLQDKQVQAGKNDMQTDWKYAVEAKIPIDHNYHSSRLDIKCWEQEMVRIGPPYLVDCAGQEPITGNSRADARTGEMLTDAEGNPIDFETGKAVKCE